MRDLAAVLATRGQLHEGFQLAAERTARLVEQGRRIANLAAGLDSAELVGLVEENVMLARQVLQRSLQRMPPDSLPLVERPYGKLLEVATYVGDTALVRRTRADYQSLLVAGGKTIARPAV